MAVVGQETQGFLTRKSSSLPQQAACGGAAWKFLAALFRKRQRGTRRGTCRDHLRTYPATYEVLTLVRHSPLVDSIATAKSPRVRALHPAWRLDPLG